MVCPRVYIYVYIVFTKNMQLPNKSLGFRLILISWAMVNRITEPVLKHLIKVVFKTKRNLCILMIISLIDLTCSFIAQYRGIK